IQLYSPVFQALYEYLKAMDFDVVEFMNDNYEEPNHYCEAIWVELHFSYNTPDFRNIEWHFESPCNENYKWILKTNKIVRVTQYSNVKNSFYNVIREMHPYKKPAFRSQLTIELPKRQTCWTESKLKSDFLTNGADLIEGIYEN